ncbi:YpmS family protein [Neobacillus thermocopriae]|uniref:YpmS family protein n=1 Tax=Neobacillus thermocopriae TaxID=1215031 RepID=A0A6B3TSG0_9BACI|nr:YpmS family protein [Neobacillus thermocopriae]MED3625479.1 YpmS family protein [Neobacillus thermocopriae]MED3714604.1 YpmS family protein [Neobacillus thermocopriae]NEX78951.1 YpmS family protein [Neobacillus thermocopriae]
MKNKWKIGFLILLGANLLFAIIIFSLVLTPDQEIKNVKSKDDNNYVSFQVHSNKYDLNQLINHYIKKEAADSPIEYRVLLGDDVELYGSLPVFSQEVNMKLTFVPKALENGDLVLIQKSMSIGNLPLPISYVLKFISENYKLPKGVEIRPNDKQIYVHMQQLNLKSDMKIQVDQIDLKNDRISFFIFVPVS